MSREFGGFKPVRLTNKDMVCKDCKYALGNDEIIYQNSIRCLKYQNKPLNVKAGGECEYYAKASKG